MKKIELLSPAKDLDCGIAAINCGADAVYIGAPKYGARAAAGNSLKDIETLINYAHKFWVKVYVTVNTIIYDDELEDVQKLIHKLYKIGTDAIIIQDIGILEMDLPPIPIIASTQTQNYSLERIKFLEGIGIQRVILARELSLNQIKEIRNSTKVELEFFIHGALCVCYSGQCYFSFATTGRSANRGECSQPCRMLYSLEDSNRKFIIKDKYLLSLKDLNLSAHLQELIDAGITSFKIEGRLKDINYVKNITAYYRQRLDLIVDRDESLSKSSSGKSIFNFQPDPERTFNRGYTEHFIKGVGKNLASINTPKSIGKYIGKVSRIGKDFFEIDTNEKIVCGDGICFFDKNEELNGMNVNRIEKNKIYSKEINGIFVGLKIYRNHDHLFLKELSNDNSHRKIGVSISLWDKDNKIIVSAKDNDKNEVKCDFIFEESIAENLGKSFERIEKQLKKSGESIFEIQEVKINFNKALFLTIAALNEMRRKVLKLLEYERIKNYPRQSVKIKSNNVQFPQNKLNYLNNVVNKKAKEFYYKHGAEIIEYGFELLDETKGKIILTSKYCIKEQLNICPLYMTKPEEKSIKEPLFLRDKKRKFTLEFNCRKCEMSIIL